MKTTLDLRPVRHRKEDRIRAHVILCWLALLLIRIAENQTDDTWMNLRDELQRLHLGTFTGPAGSKPAAHPAHQTANATSCAPSTCPSRHASWRSTPPRTATRPAEHRPAPATRPSARNP